MFDAFALCFFNKYKVTIRKNIFGKNNLELVKQKGNSEAVFLS